MNIAAASYIHLPWCISKCPYCDFNSRTIGQSGPNADHTSRYTEAMLKDLDYELPQWQGRNFASIFFGGGTPSLFPDKDIAAIIDRMAKHCCQQPEITLEANPGTADSSRLKGYHSAGVNRLSLGAQSFNNDALKRLGRIHDSAAITRAMDIARTTGFDNINLDIMYGLPQQSHVEALLDLKTAIALNPEHISWYQLTLEQNTAFAAKPPAGMPDEDTIERTEQQGYQLLEQAGYHRYEISAFSKQGRQCRHNLNYWNFGDYMGIGAGAHGKQTINDSIIRSQRPAHPEHYMQRAGTAEAVTTKTLDHKDKMVEFALNALRLCQGFSEQQFTSTTQMAKTELQQPLQIAIEKGLLTKQGSHIKPTPAGIKYMNETLAIFNSP